MTNHIKKQIQEAIDEKYEFAGKIQRDKFCRYANKFINATTYGESERFARQFINFILRQHGKGFVGPTLETLNLYELYEDYEYGNNVFILLIK